MTQSKIDEQVVSDKWTDTMKSLGIVDPSRQKWMEQYANSHMRNLSQDNINSAFGISPMGVSQSQSTSIFGSQSHQPLLPIAMKIAAQTIGQQLVPISPMGGGESDEEKAKRLGKIRDGKIDAVFEDKPYELPEDLEEPKGAFGELMYLDYKYSSATSSTSSTLPTSKYQKNLKPYKKK